LERDQRASDLPTAIRLSSYDPARDYQIGEARASVSDGDRFEESKEFPGAIDADTAKALAQGHLARAWAERDRLTLRLPTRYLFIMPGTELQLPLVPNRWRVESRTIDGFACVLELRPSCEAASAIPADSGRRIERLVATGETVVALFNTPVIWDQAAGRTLLLAASSPDPDWHGQTVQVCTGAHRFIERTVRRKSVLGRALSHLRLRSRYLDVELIDHDQWLVNCNPEAMAAGANHALLGDEVFQFSKAEPIGPGRFRLRGLLRGRAGTEGAMEAHEVGEYFVLLEQDALRAISFPPWLEASKVSAVAGCG